VGPDGAGKSTLIDCLSMFKEPVAGEIVFAGRSLVRRVAPATVGLVRFAAWLLVLNSLLWLPLGLGVVWPATPFPREAGLVLLLLTLFRFYLARALAYRRPWSRITALFFVVTDAVCAATWLWHSDAFAGRDFFGLFPVYPLLVPVSLVLLMAAPVLFFLLNLPRVREAFGEPPSTALAIELGLIRTFQEGRILSSLSALDNVKLGRHAHTRSNFFGIVTALPAVRREERDTAEKAAACLRFVGLGEELASPAGTLALGARRRLEIARALAAEPRLLLLDEPAAGLNPAETAALGVMITRISRAGIAVLLVEQDMKLTLELANRVYVIDHGKLIAGGEPAVVRRDPAVIAACLGARHGAAGN